MDNNSKNFSQELFAIEKNDKVGRYAVAKENLKAGQIIFSELPFAYGPKSGKIE